MNEKQGCITGPLTTVWRGLDFLRRACMNLLFLAFLALVLVGLFAETEPSVPGEVVLRLEPKGEIVDQLAGDAFDRALAKVEGLGETETLLQDLLDALEKAKDDERVKAVWLDLDRMGGAGLSKLQELRRGIESFRESGKKVIALADMMDQRRYYLAAAADEVFLNDSGFFFIEGFGAYGPYFRDGLDRLGVEVNVFRVGEYKSAVEPFERNDMSPAAREANLDWLGDLWAAWVADVAAMRSLEPAAVRDWVERYPEHLRESGGNSAAAAKAGGLVDVVGPRNAAEARLAEILGRDGKTALPTIELADYLAAVRPPQLPGLGGDAVGLVVARGTIVDGEQPPGAIGGDSTSTLIRQARDDESIKALVLRVDSGGGSALASEVIRRELEGVQKAGKPVVVSMGSVAASGGYWIATAADEVFASPTTITGSIGIFGLIPTFQRPLETYLGVRVDGVGTAPLAGALRFDRAMSPEAKDVIQQVVEDGYRDFLERVAAAREMTVEEVDRVARGRVWSGEDAERLGLVDKLGGLAAARLAAIERAGLGENTPLRLIEKELSFGEQLVIELMAGAAVFLPEREPMVATASPLEALGRFLARQRSLLGQLNDPAGLYAHCFCEVP